MNTRANKEWLSKDNYQPCLANNAKLKQYKSQKPIPPEDFDPYIQSHESQCILRVPSYLEPQKKEFIIFCDSSPILLGIINTLIQYCGIDCATGFKNSPFLLCLKIDLSNYVTFARLYRSRKKKLVSYYDQLKNEVQGICYDPKEHKLIIRP